MNWSDEHYVKLYTRETLTWRSWGWEARCVFLHLLKCVDHSGFIETGRMEPAAALALQLLLPSSVVAPGLAELVESGTVELFDSALLIPKFVEAQEARKTDAQKKRDERSRNIAKRRGSMSPAVTRSHPMSPAVTQTDPPAQPSPAQPDPSPARNTLRAKKPPAEHEAPNPRHLPLVAALADGYFEILGAKYDFQARDFADVKRLLLLCPDNEGIAFRWRWALDKSRDQFHTPKVRKLSDLVLHWNAYPAAKAEERAQ